MKTCCGQLVRKIDKITRQSLVQPSTRPERRQLDLPEQLAGEERNTQIQMKKMNGKAKRDFIKETPKLVSRRLHKNDDDNGKERGSPWLSLIEKKAKGCREVKNYDLRTQRGPRRNNQPSQHRKRYPSTKWGRRFLV